jgi:hypothetical protein
MIQGLSGGSKGVLTGRYSGYWNTGKGSTWEGGIHEAGFAYWYRAPLPLSCCCRRLAFDRQRSAASCVRAC